MRIMIAMTCSLLMKSKRGNVNMAERKIKKKRRINFEAFISVEVTDEILIRLNEPEMKLMAQAFINLMKEN